MLYYLDKEGVELGYEYPFPMKWAFMKKFAPENATQIKWRKSDGGSIIAPLTERGHYKIAREILSNTSLDYSWGFEDF